MARRSRKSEKDECAENALHVEAIESEAQPKPVKAKRRGKEVIVQQWFITADNENDGSRIQKFVLATCGMKARQFFRERYPSYQIFSVIHSGETEHMTSWLDTHSPFYS